MENKGNITYLFDSERVFRAYLEEIKRVLTEGLNKKGKIEKHKELKIKEDLIIYLACLKYRNKVKGFNRLVMGGMTKEEYLKQEGYSKSYIVLFDQYKIYDELIDVTFCKVDSIIVLVKKETEDRTIYTCWDKESEHKIEENPMYNFIMEYIRGLYVKSYDELLMDYMDDINN